MTLSGGNFGRYASAKTTNMQPYDGTGKGYAWIGRSNGEVHLKESITENAKLWGERL